MRRPYYDHTDNIASITPGKALLHGSHNLSDAQCQSRCDMHPASPALHRQNIQEATIWLPPGLILTSGLIW